MRGLCLGNRRVTLWHQGIVAGVSLCCCTGSAAIPASETGLARQGPWGMVWSCVPGGEGWISGKGSAPGGCWAMGQAPQGRVQGNLQNALRNMVEFCAGPAVGLDGPCVSFAAQDML